jgi:N-acetylneuraminate synthase
MSTILVAELGANMNGDIAVAEQMIAAAQNAGASYVKFQKRDVDLAVPEAQKQVPKSTPWGTMPYLEYRRRLEFGPDEFDEIAGFCDGLDIKFFASAWDIPSAEFLLRYECDYLKIPSAKITDLALLRWVAANAHHEKPVISTGMSTMEEIRAAMKILPDAIILHCNSTYPAPNEELNLRTIQTLQAEFPGNAVGYSGHERGVAPSVAAVALGATMVERHFTLDRSMWGSDQAASLEPSGFARMSKDIRIVEAALGDGIVRVYPGEEAAKAKLRGG